MKETETKKYEILPLVLHAVTHGSKTDFEAVSDTLRAGEIQDLLSDSDLFISFMLPNGGYRQLLFAAYLRSGARGSAGKDSGKAKELKFADVFEREGFNYVDFRAEKSEVYMLELRLVDENNPLPGVYKGIRCYVENTSAGISLRDRILQRNEPQAPRTELVDEAEKTLFVNHPVVVERRKKK